MIYRFTIRDVISERYETMCDLLKDSNCIELNWSKSVVEFYNNISE